jgi:hypothetical protein
MHETAKATATTTLQTTGMRNRNTSQVESPRVKAEKRQGGRRAGHIDASTCELLSYMGTSTLHLKYPK